MSEPKLVRIAVVARWMSRSPQTIRDWIEDGTIPAGAWIQPKKRGGFLFHHDRILAWIESRSGTPQAPAPTQEGATT